MEKRYLAFGGKGQYWEHHGGFADFRGAFASLDDALNAMQAVDKYGRIWLWYEIIEVPSFIVMAVSPGRKTPDIAGIWPDTQEAAATDEMPLTSS